MGACSSGGISTVPPPGSLGTLTVVRHGLKSGADASMVCSPGSSGKGTSTDAALKEPLSSRISRPAVGVGAWIVSLQRRASRAAMCLRARSPRSG